MHDKQSAGLRVALYARVSTDEQREGQTIDSQIAELETFARQKGWQVVDVYRDEGWSGSLMGRPALDRIRDDARKGLFQAVLINDVDRLARDVAHLGVIKRDLERQSVQVVFRKLPTESSPTSNLMVNILGSFAEFERELIADRTRRGRRHKVEVRKQFLGSKAAYGYRYVPRDRAAGKEGYLEMIAEEVALVRRLFAWVDQEGLSARQVVCRLNEKKIPPRFGERGWARSSVLRVLRNEMYAGVWYYNKHRRTEPARQGPSSDSPGGMRSSNRQRPKLEWLPVELPQSLRIVPRALWERVQQQLDRNLTFSPRNEKHSYLLKGLVRCGGCRSRYVGNPCHGRYYYRCLNRCKMYPMILEERLNETVWGAMEEAMQNPRLILETMAEARRERADNAARRHVESRRIHQEQRKIEMEESRILEGYRLGVLSPTHLGAELEKLTIRRNAAQARLMEIGADTEPVPFKDVEKSVQDYCRHVARRLASFTDLARQRLLRLLLREIIFEGSLVRIRGVIPVDQAGADTEEPATGRVYARLAAGGTATTSLKERGRSPSVGLKGQESDANFATTTQSFSAFDLMQEIQISPRPVQPRDRLGRFIASSQSERPNSALFRAA